MLEEAVAEANSQPEGFEELDQSELAMHKERKEVESRMARLLDTIESGLTSNSVRKRLGELENRKEVIQAELTVLTTERKALRQERINVEEAEQAFRHF